MSCILELPQLPQDDRPAQRHRRSGGVQPELDAQRPPERELLRQPTLGSDLRGPALESREGIVGHGAAMLPSASAGTLGFGGTLRAYAEGPGTPRRLCRVRPPPQWDVGVQPSAAGGLPRATTRADVVP